MFFSNRRRDGSEGRGVEGKYIPREVTGAEIFYTGLHSCHQPVILLNTFKKCV